MVPAHAGRHLGFSMALFILGGTVAFGIGPVFVSWYVTRFGLENLPYVGLAGAVMVGILFIIVPRPTGEGLKQMGFMGVVRHVLGPVRKPLTIIWLIIVFRVYVVQSIFTFAPILLANQHLGLIRIGWVISLFVVAGSISGLVAGTLADRIGYKPVFLVSYLFASPSLYLFLHSTGNWLLLSSFIAGFFTLATIALATAMAQTLVDKGQSLVASLTMGLAFGTGGVLTPVTGKLADIFSIQTVLGVVIWVPMLATVLVFFLPGAESAHSRKG